MTNWKQSSSISTIFCVFTHWCAWCSSWNPHCKLDNNDLLVSAAIFFFFSPSVFSFLKVILFFLVVVWIRILLLTAEILFTVHKTRCYVINESFCKFIVSLELFPWSLFEVFFIKIQRKVETRNLSAYFPTISYRFYFLNFIPILNLLNFFDINSFLTYSWGFGQQIESYFLEITTCFFGSEHKVIIPFIYFLQKRPGEKVFTDSCTLKLFFIFWRWLINYLNRKTFFTLVLLFNNR